jgi:hypothetical protein
MTEANLKLDADNLSTSLHLSYGQAGIAVVTLIGFCSIFIYEKKCGDAHYESCHSGLIFVIFGITVSMTIPHSIIRAQTIGRNLPKLISCALLLGYLSF